MADEQAKAPAVLDGEDWHLDHQPKQEKHADPSLAGLYEVVHGSLFFSPEKTIKTGRRVRLDAEHAAMFIERGLVRRVVGNGGGGRAARSA